MATMHPQSETRRMPVRLSAEEVAGKAEELAAKVNEARRQEDAIAIKKEAWNTTKKAMEAELKLLRLEAEDLAEVVETGQEEQDVVADWLYALNAGLAFLVRRDTQELISQRTLREEERQQVIGEVLQEPTPEQLAEWSALRPETMDAEPKIEEPAENDLPEDEQDFDDTNHKTDVFEGREAETEEICGETIEHDLREVGEGVWQCRRCDAEIVDEFEEDAAAETALWDGALEERG